MDWKSSLESLRASLPQTEDTPEVESAPANSPAAAVNPFGENARLDILLDKKGRKGKAATIVAGFTIDDATVEDIARKLKQRLACGGSSRCGEILIQGDKRREALATLTSMGLKARII